MKAYLLGGRPLVFPFFSGALRYDCAGCEAPCCKGAALGIGSSRELVTIQQAQPKAPLFAVPSFHQSQRLALQTPAEACWFLDKKRRCRLERVLGHLAKPAGCRLFPFVRFKNAGETVVVLPDFLCPLLVGAPTAVGPASHDGLALEIHQAQVGRSGHKELPVPRDLPWGDAMPLERRVVEEAERHLFEESYVPYAELQYLLALASLGIDGKEGAMRKVEESLRRFIGASEVPSREAVREVVALTGVLRMQASSLPRREVPAVLVALSVMVGVAEHLRGAVRTPRTTVSIWEAHLPLLYVLAHLGSRPVVKSGVTLREAVGELPTVRAPLLKVLDEVERNGRRGVAQPLEDILRVQHEAFAAPLSADAVAMLHGLGRVLLRACTFVPL
ncbi:MAG: YkgJ family cysteine cluster protein [Deltaproteobacteria bacterium]|nr:YkgJ family cysteine cluster protein [Deltaproteobacteria bacterium]